MPETFYERLSALDATFLDVEAKTAPMHVGAALLFDAKPLTLEHGGLDIERLTRYTLAAVDSIPRYRQRVEWVPGLRHPVWVDDPDFDLDYHVRRIACPAPGDRKAFCELVSEVYAWPLDMTKPLWLCWVVEALENNEVAMVTLVHHAYTDGSGAARLLHKVYSLSQQDAEPQQHMAWVPEKTPGKLSLLVRALIDLPRTWITSLPKIRQGMQNVREMKKKYAESGGELPPSAFTDTRDSPFNIMVGRGRTFVFDTMPLDEIKAISKGFDVTINDLFVAATAGAYRKFMQTRGYNPDTGPLVTAIPVSKRPPLEEDDMIGNKTSSDYLAMPVHLPDPLARLKAAAHAGKVMKAHIVAAEGSDLSNILEVTPPALIRLLDWVVKHKDGKFGVWGNAAISNVPGPREPLYMGAMKLNNWISMGMVAHGLGLNTTVWSYAGQFNLCILADKKLLPDGWELIAYFRDAFAEYRVLLDEKADREPSDPK